MSAITVTITSGGKTMNHEFEILAIDVSKEFNRIPTAELQFIEGDIANKKFKVLDDSFFDIGKELNISLKYEGSPQDEKNIFSGVIVNKLLSLNSNGSLLTVELSDVAIRMHSGKENAVYSNEKDSKIFEKLLEKNSIKIGSRFEETTIEHPQMIQHYATDWDFLITRAEANAKVVQVENGAVSIFQPTTKVQDSSQQNSSLELGLDQIYDFDLQITGDHQFQKVNTVGWDMAKQDLTKSQVGKSQELFKHKDNVLIENKILGTEETTLVHTAHVTTEELKIWSEAKTFKNGFSLVQGWIKMTGTTKYELGNTLEIKEMSKSFSGVCVISGIRHEVTKDSWSTHLQIGMSSCWFSKKNGITDTPAAGLLPGVNGLQIGVIKNNAKDPQNLYRIPVFIPAFGKEQNTIWARLSTLDAGKNKGTFCIPEPGDEVIVGFLNDDPRQAIIVGSVYSPANKPPKDLQENKNSKGIFTKSGSQLFFNEEEEQITIATSEKNKIVINQKEGAITLSDNNENVVTMNKNGIQLSSAKDFEITSKGNLNIEAKGSIKIKGKTVELL